MPLPIFLDTEYGEPNITNPVPDTANRPSNSGFRCRIRVGKALGASPESSSSLRLRRGVREQALRPPAADDPRPISEFELRVEFGVPRFLSRTSVPRSRAGFRTRDFPLARGRFNA